MSFTVYSGANSKSRAFSAHDKIFSAELFGLLGSGLSYQIGGMACQPREMSLPKNMPSSNSSHMGIARSDCEITSGGVSNMPKTKHPTMM